MPGTCRDSRPATGPDVLLRAIEAANPDATALQDACRAITYGSLGPLLERELDWLAPTPGERFALLADNGVPWALADLALHLDDRLCVPLPGSFTDALKLHALDDAGVDTLLTDDAERARALLPGWRVDGAGPGSSLVRLRRAAGHRSRPVVPVGTAKVTYTSGSTSTPKGVCLSRESLVATARAVVDATNELAIARHLCVLPLPTLLENIAGLYAPLLRGATCLLPSAVQTGMSYGGVDGARLLGAVGEARPNSLILVPELLLRLVSAAERGWRVPASLRFVAVGGARVSPTLLERSHALGIPAFEGYGLSECASVVCLNTPGAARIGSAGRPLPHVRVRVDDAGQVHVTGNAMLGYLGDAPLPRGAELATGDLGMLDERGFLHLRGRAGNRFITSLGRNVSPEWIESEIAQRLGGCPVLAVGEARPYVVALIGADPGEIDDRAVARAIAAANAGLPDYAQVRRWARCTTRPSYADGTMTANGRPRRHVLHARHAALIDALFAESLAS